MKRWYALTTKAGPFRPTRGLREQGFAVFVPKMYVGYRPVHDARRLFAKTELRFSGYIFVWADAEEGELSAISNTAGVGGLVPPYPASPQPIDDDIIEDLRAAEDEELDAIRTRATQKGSPFPLGSTVRILRGKVRDTDQAGMHGQVAGYRNGILTLFVGSWVVKVPENDCQAVAATQGAAA